MDVWVWAIVIVALILLAIDWMIVMGKNPRLWKGGGKHGKR